MFQIVIDAGSKWIEAFSILTSTSRATIQQLETLFAQFRLPDITVTMVPVLPVLILKNFFQAMVSNIGNLHHTIRRYAKQGLKRMMVPLMKSCHDFCSIIASLPIVPPEWNRNNNIKNRTMMLMQYKREKRCTYVQDFRPGHTRLPNNDYDIMSLHYINKLQMYSQNNYTKAGTVDYY